MEMNIKKFIINTLVEKYHISADRVNENTIYDDLYLDSLALLEITAMIEKKFNLKIPDNVIESNVSIAKSAHRVLKESA